MTGDRRACPSCADVMRFYERYVVSRGRASITVVRTTRFKPAATGGVKTSGVTADTQ